MSLFAGIGGLEDKSSHPLVYCELDPASRKILSRLYPQSDSWDDVSTFTSPRAEVIAGGWPCQDITPAGRMVGLSGSRSSLFFRMVEIAVDANAHTIIGENVPNLLVLRRGSEFQRVIDALIAAGYSTVAWRTLDARQFGLPHSRPRVYIVASKHKEIATGLHRPISGEWLVKSAKKKTKTVRRASGFYWTGGDRMSICYSAGYTPPLKVGSARSKGTSPVAVFYGKHVRKLSPEECLILQGFDPELARGHILGDVFRMAGNAVPKPVGQFVMASVWQHGEWEGVRSGFAAFGPHGLLADGIPWNVEHETSHLASNLADFLDTESTDSLSPQAAAGLLTRVIRSHRSIPVELFDVLYSLSRHITDRLKGTKINSFTILHEQMDAMAYRRSLPPSDKLAST